MTNQIRTALIATIRVPIQWKDNHSKTLDYLLDEADAAIAADAILEKWDVTPKGEDDECECFAFSAGECACGKFRSRKPSDSSSTGGEL